MNYINCNLCCRDDYTLFKKIDGYQLVKCKQCGLVYLNPRPIQKELNKKYYADYHIERLLGKEPKTEKDIKDEIDKNIGRAEEIVRFFGDNGKLLDIGCGPGFFIACLKQYGWNVTGIDISEWASTFAKEKMGLNVITGSIGEIKFREKFDVITMYHNLEHLPDPHETLKKISMLLTDNGSLIIKGPNLASFDRLWHGKNWRGYTDKSHLYFFTTKTYQSILEKAGFSVQKIIFQYWNPSIHFMESILGGGGGRDCPPRIFNGLSFKIISQIGFLTAKLLSLKGRDLTIYAKKTGVL